jgi:hypothetical protein
MRWGRGATALTENALVAMIEKLEKQNGGPYPPRTAALRVGRPFK